MRTPTCIFALLGLTSIAAAQSEVVGVNIRLNESFKSETVDFVNNYTILGGETRNLYGIDFNADSTILYGIDDATFEIVTIDPDLGVSTPTGVFATGLPDGLTGLTAAADGTTWYVSEYDGFDSWLSVGDIVTGVFTRVGTVPMSDGIVIDIAINAAGDLYGMSISTDSLLSIDTATGIGTDIGPTGLASNFAQGMDFDPVSGELYAAIYTGGGTGQWSTLDLTTGLATQLEDTLPLNAEMEIAIREIDLSVGSNYCAAAVNSTGVSAEISAAGSDVVMDNDLTLTASSLPTNAFGFFIVSSTQGFVMMPGGSSGNLCIVGDIGRYVGAGQIQNSGAAGAFSLAVDLTMIPQPMGAVSTNAGDTWNFQTWFRDSSPGGPTSNFTNGLEILFQ